MGKSQSRLGFKSRFEHFGGGVIQQFKNSIRQPTIGIRFDFLLFDSSRDIRQLNLCWLLLTGPFQCLVVLPVELTGFNCKQQW